MTQSSLTQMNFTQTKLTETANLKPTGSVFVLKHVPVEKAYAVDLNMLQSKLLQYFKCCSDTHVPQLAFKFAAVRFKCGCPMSAMLSASTTEVVINKAVSPVVFLKLSELRKIVDGLKQHCGFVPKNRFTDDCLILTCGHHKSCISVEIPTMGYINLM